MTDTATIRSIIAGDAMVPSKSLLIAGAVAWSGIIAGMLTVERGPVPVVAHNDFRARWANVSTAEAPLKKQDRFIPLEPPPPALDLAPAKPVKVVPFMVVPEQSHAEDRETRPRKASRREGICAHGRHWYTKPSGWRAWRCRQ